MLQEEGHKFAIMNKELHFWWKRTLFDEINESFQEMEIVYMKMQHGSAAYKGKCQSIHEFICFYQ